MIVFFIIGLCSFVMITIGVYAYQKKEAMWFWAGSQEDVAQEKYTDVETFNHRNGIMWIIYGVSFYLPMVISYIFDLSEGFMCCC